MYMIDKDKFHVLNFVKKEEYAGSMEGMRYMLRKKELEGETWLNVTIWPEPYNFIKTPESKKQHMDFTFDPDGLEKAVDWMNEQYEQQKELWNIVR